MTPMHTAWSFLMCMTVVCVIGVFLALVEYAFGRGVAAWAAVCIAAVLWALVEVVERDVWTDEDPERRDGP